MEAQQGCTSYGQVGEAIPSGGDPGKLYFWEVVRLVLWLSMEGKNQSSLFNVAPSTQGC